MEEFSITLLNGNQLPCVLKPEQPEKIENDGFKLDTTGQYLKIGSRPTPEMPDLERQAERQYGHHLFCENAWLLLEHAEEIMSDSRMFLAPVKVQNGIAYSGTSGFRHPTVGVYLEWWLNFSEAAVDGDGNLVWYISGTPLSGRNCCSSVNPDGEAVKIRQRTRFLEIWSSFVKVNNRYNEAKQRCEAMSFEDLICKFRGEDYRLRIIELRHEMKELVMMWERNRLLKSIDQLKKKLNDSFNLNKKEFLKANSQKIAAFYKEYAEKEEEIRPIHEEYVSRRKELLRRYHNGTIEGDYHALLVDAGKVYVSMKRGLSLFCNSFMRETFPKNINGIRISDVIKFGKKLNS